METEFKLLAPGNSLARTNEPETAQAITFWAEAVSDPTSPRLRDLLRIKRTAVVKFFAYAGKAMAQVTPEDVRDWRQTMETEKLSPTTIYNNLSFLSSFFTWAMKEPLLANMIRYNPVNLARSKAPKPYQSRSVKSLTDVDLAALHRTIQSHAKPGNLIGLRDYALFLFFITTGLRRAEILSLRACDLMIEESRLVMTYRKKGGQMVTQALDEPAVKEALWEYLRADRRLTVLTRREDAPIWLRHDQGAAAGDAQKALAAWSFARQMKSYAKEAGITSRFHLHQMRHTFARIVAEEAGSLLEAQEALGHQNPATTRLYVQRVGVKRDKFSRTIKQRLKV